MVKCFFKLHHSDYWCEIDSENLPMDVNQDTFQGEHWHSKCNSDVNSLRIENSQIEKIPNGIGKVFENLTQLEIFDSNLKSISKEDLKQFPRLEYLNVRENHLKELPGDLFEFNKNLEKVFFVDNKIKYIGVEILDKLQKFDYGSFRGNININTFVDKNDIQSMKKFQEILLTKCQKPKEEN